MTTMANFWIRLKPCPVTLMLRPPLGGREGMVPEWAHLGKGGAQPAPEQVPCKAVSPTPPCFWILLQVCASTGLLQ